MAAQASGKKKAAVKKQAAGKKQASGKKKAAAKKQAVGRKQASGKKKAADKKKAAVKKQASGKKQAATKKQARAGFTFSVPPSAIALPKTQELPYDTGSCLFPMIVVGHPRGRSAVFTIQESVSSTLAGAFVILPGRQVERVCIFGFI